MAFAQETVPDALETVQLNAFTARVVGMNRYVGVPAFYRMEKAAAWVDGLNAALDSLPERPPVFVYFVENSCSHPTALSFPPESEMGRYIREHLRTDGFGSLRYTTFGEFCGYFYATDPHWNCRGSYQGYLDVIRLLKGEEEPVLVPAEMITLPVLFDGSYSKAVQQPISQEMFSLYRYDGLPETVSLVNGRKKSYGNPSLYLSGKVSGAPLTNHYSLCYGGDVGVVEFRRPDENGQTLLIVADSMDNPLLPLLSAHYSRVVSVDPRHYEKDMGKPCSLSALLAEYRPDQVLVLGSAVLFALSPAPLP